LDMGLGDLNGWWKYGSRTSNKQIKENVVLSSYMIVCWKGSRFSAMIDISLHHSFLMWARLSPCSILIWDYCWTIVHKSKRRLLASKAPLKGGIRWISRFRGSIPLFQRGIPWFGGWSKFASRDDDYTLVSSTWWRCGLQGPNLTICRLV
jgi:hypothetical protein